METCLGHAPALDQWFKLARCVELVAAREAERGAAFARVLRLRPDARVGASSLPRAAAAGLAGCLAPLRGAACPDALLRLRNRVWEFRDGGGLLEGLARCVGRPLEVDADVDVSIIRTPAAATLVGALS
mmetsp:Transcript_25423/g.76364  ORF Transcript_25423/g.76364 Transcript_25423/m.76364 type:complete len:129 (+) Transcript_25423:218-604(+)